METQTNIQFLTADQVADLLQISRKALYEMRYAGDGPPAVRIGGRRLRFRASDLQEWLAAHED